MMLTFLFWLIQNATLTLSTQFVYNNDFNASCYSRLGGFSGAQIDYDSSTLSSTLFDGLAIRGDIIIGGNDYFSLKINLNQPIDVNFYPKFFYLLSFVLF